MLNEAARNYGNYHAHGYFTKHVEPGHPTWFTVHLTTGSGAPAMGREVDFSTRGSSLSLAHQHAKVGPGGDAIVKVNVLRFAKAKLKWSVKGLPALHGLLSLPRSSNQQQLLGNAPLVRKTGSKSFTATKPSAPKFKAVCPQNCTGVANATAVKCLTTGVATATLDYVDRSHGNKVLASSHWGKSDKQVCRTASFKAQNGHHIQPVLHYTVNGKQLTPLKFKEHIIDCPPLVGFGVSQKFLCDCADVTLTTDANNGTNPVTVTYSDDLGNKVTYQVAPGGASVSHIFKVNASTVHWTVVETTPYATHSGVRKVTVNSSTAVTVS